MTDDVEARPALVAAMLDRGFYPHSPDSVELRETHISWVFLAGEFVYKVKKPLTLPFLDYGTRERRHALCREEVRLNRRFAPEIYLDVVGLACSGGRWRLVAEDDPSASEHAVRMRRIDESRSLAALAARGSLEPPDVLGAARRIAEIHAEAPVVVEWRRSLELLIATLEENLTTLRATGASLLEQHRLDAAEHFTRAFLAARRDYLCARGRRGYVRDCHGDLRAEHVIVPEHGDVYIFDCVEFDPGLRRIDVAADLAFLFMDLAALGQSGHATTLVAGYREAGGDPGDDSTLSFFAAYRAWVRAKIACLRADELPCDDPERTAQEDQARKLLRLGHRFAWSARRPLIIVVCGVAATGKTTLAQELARLSGWSHHSSDLIRKRLAGVDPEQRARPDHYTREFTSRTYRELGAVAREAFDDSGGVIVDATFHRREERGAFFDGLGAARDACFFVECRAPESELVERARRRGLERGQISDADAEVVRKQLQEFEPLDDVAPEARTALATDSTPDRLAVEVERAVDGPPRWEPVPDAGASA